MIKLIIHKFKIFNNIIIIIIIININNINNINNIINISINNSYY